MERTNNDLKSTISSLKEIVTIVAALAITNTLLRTMPSTMDDLAFSDFDGLTVAIGAVLLLNVVRFHHGNMRHLDSVYMGGQSKLPARDASTVARRRTAIDFTVVFMQAIILAILSFLVIDAAAFITTFTTLLIIDVFWYLGSEKASSDDTEIRHQRRWTLNNVSAVIALLITIAFRDQMHVSLFGVLGTVIIAVNAIVDFIVSSDFYFPLLHVDDQ